MTNFVKDVTNSVNIPDVRGTYCLIFHVDTIRFKVKSGRKFFLERGNYIYVGSAFGSGGIRTRVKRHLKRRKKLHWHIDFITSHDSFEFIDLMVFEDMRIECKIAQLLSLFLVPVDGFGCTDCSCSSHLFRLPDNTWHEICF